ncbi:glycosyltransferase involved in cell wall biosynthesis [Enterococcus rotai]|uniref:Glycosyl transferase family 1 n=1 Tax=Enterococcus rotai TaxID=118060 RepID=A0A0U2VIM1_9ENTE|nr:glycosyltransferase family 1 protein [Enterococcus rotai]ALS37355.1 hypothetical protein ATZ35_09365 [Enterococcus rotai]
MSIVHNNSEKKNKVRVLIFGMSNLLGGVETYMFNYYNHLDLSKIQVDFVTMYPTMYFEKEVEAKGAKVYHVTEVKKNPQKFISEVKTILSDEQYDIVHVNMLSAANILPVTIAKKMGVKKIFVHSHNANTPNGLLRKAMHQWNKRKIVRLATDYLACSKKAGTWLFGEELADQIIIIPNGVEIEQYKFDAQIRTEVRKELGLAEDQLVIGHVGAFREQKNHDFLIDIFATLHKKNPDAVLVLVGQGELQAKIQSKVTQLHLENNIKFLGVRQDSNRIYQAMDIFVLPSLFEGLPVVGVEAQAAGLPLIISDQVTRELAITENCQFLPIDDPEKWAEAILATKIANRDISEDFSKNGYDINIASKSLNNLYCITK